MEPTTLTIDILAPLELTVPLHDAITLASKPRFRLIGFTAETLQPGMFRLQARFHPDDVTPDTPNEELVRLRDDLLSLLALSAMVPIQMLSRGVFTFQLFDCQYQAKSLGPMSIEASPLPLITLGPLINGLSAQPEYRTAAFLLHQAMNTRETAYRFINLAMAVELLVHPGVIPSGVRPPGPCPSRSI